MKHQQILKAATIFLIAAILLSGFYIAGKTAYRRGWFLPHWIEWQNREFSLTPESFADESEVSWNLILSRKALTIEPAIYATPEELLVQDTLITDLTDDGAPELILLVWKIGSYGEHHPFWVQENDSDWSQHIFIFSCDEDGIHPIWMSSATGIAIASLEVTENHQLLARHASTDNNFAASLWAWETWGLTLVTTFEHAPAPEELSTASQDKVILSPNEANPETQETGTLTFMALGDVITHEPILRYGERKGNFDFLFDPLRSYIQEADCAMVNLETPLVTDPNSYSDYPLFGTPIPVGESIVKAGFTVVSLATNHVLDQGETGVQTTLDFFTSSPVIAVGLTVNETTNHQESEEQKEGESEVSPLPYWLFTKNGMTVAFLNYTYGTNGTVLPENSPYSLCLLDDPDRITAEINEAASLSDCVILLVHWGEEYSPVLTEEQQSWTQVFLAAGADVVIGTHPHVLQPMELLMREDGHQMLVYYSLGNCVSAQNTPETILGGMARFTLRKGKDGSRIVSFSLEPVVTHQAYGLYTAYLLADYPEELAAIHRLEINKDALMDLFSEETSLPGR